MMHQSKLLLNLKLLNKPELSRLKEFVSSSYFNRHPRVLQLMEIIYAAHPDWDSSGLDKEKVFQAIFPGKRYDYHRLSHIMNYLQELVEKFLSVEAFLEDDFLPHYMVLKKIKGRWDEKHYEKQLKRSEKVLSESSTQNIHSFYNRSLIDNELDLFYINRKRKTDKNYLQQKSDNIDLFYISSKLEYWCDMLNRSNILNMEFDYPLLDEVLQLIHSDEQKYLSVPIINLNYLILQTLREPEEEEYYFGLKNDLLSYSLPDRETAKSMFDYAQNYCIKRINKGDTKYLQELLDLYQKMLELELIFENGFFPPSDYKNIVTIACRLKEFEWTEQFLHQYKEMLEEKVREHVFQYNLASFYYEKADYNKALELLNRVEFSDVYFALGGRSMLMKIYFEKNESDPLFSHFDAFKTYLRRNKMVSKYQQAVHSNFIRFTRLAYQLKMSVDWKRKQELEKDASALIEKVKKTKDITNRAWLEKQINELAFF